MEKSIYLNIEGIPKLKIWSAFIQDGETCDPNCEHIFDDNYNSPLCHCMLFGVKLKSQLERCKECILIFDDKKEIK